MSYFEFRQTALRFRPETREWDWVFFDESGAPAAELSGLTAAVVTSSGRQIPLTDYPECEEIQLPSLRFPAMPEPGHWDWTLKLPGAGRKRPEVTLNWRLFGDVLEFSAAGADVVWQGSARNGRDAEHEVLAMTDTVTDDVLYCASGPAPCGAADLLYNRQTDTALKFAGTTAELTFDWQTGEYRCRFRVRDGQQVHLRREEGVCRKLFHLTPMAPLSRQHQFPTPPVGWMSWYSLRFGTCEAAVLDNARRMLELFHNFADKICIWVDWEWCHRDFSGAGCDGVDVAHPRTDAYPHGLKYVADAVKSLGAVPALWCGAAVEGRPNAFLRRHPEAVLADFPFWPGHLWLDLTHPAAVTEYVPEVFRQFLAWGYEVFKWDCWLNSLKVNDEFHDRCCRPEKSLESCIRQWFAAARAVIGDERYLLGCTIDERASLGAAGICDAFRIGGDVFSWRDFRRNGVDQTFRYYPLHNIRLYLDPDTLVLRREYSSDAQARTRVAFAALTGLQLTLGDPVAELDELRIDALKRAMPAAAVRPVEMAVKTPPGKIVQTLTAVSRPFATWFVAGLFNFDARRRRVRLRYRRLGLPAGRYAAFDFWSQRLLGISGSGTDLTLSAGESAAVRLTPLADVPAVIGTSRHLLQGAVELTAGKWDAERRELSGRLLVAGGDPVTLTIYVPSGRRVRPQAGVTAAGPLARLTLSTPENTELPWRLCFD